MEPVSLRLVVTVIFALVVSHSQTAIPVPSPVSGVIEELFVPDGEKVNAGDQLCKIRITGVCVCVCVRVCECMHVCVHVCVCAMYACVAYMCTMLACTIHNGAMST